MMLRKTIFGTQNQYNIIEFSNAVSFIWKTFCETATVVESFFYIDQKPATLCHNKMSLRPSLDIVLSPHRTKIFRFGAMKAR